MPKSNSKRESSSHALIEHALSRGTPSLFRLMTSDDGEFHSIRIYNRGVQDVLAVLKQYAGNGEVEVLFGSGADVVSAITACESAIESKRWRRDKPYGGSK